MAVEAEFTPKFRCMFEPYRYKVWWGGRGAQKSWSVARGLIIKGLEKPLRILCTRELQSSIRESVHKLISDRINSLGVQSFYHVENNSIRGANGSEFIFAGLKNNVDSIKSMEGLDIAWVEEAQKVSRNSWEVLIPTIRKEGSEIWATFNPELETDETYRRFVINTPDGAIVQKVNWDDNPWFPSVLAKERDALAKQDYDAYLNVWEGHCRQVLDGAVYARELRQATEDNRITRVPYETTKPVHTFWDLGWRDATAIWFAQAVGFEFRIIDYHQDVQRTVNHYLEVLQGKKYIYGTDYLPHDADATSMGAGGRTIKGIIAASGRRVVVLPNTKISVGINAARTIFPNCWFDEDRCSEGLNCLRRYRYEKDEDTRTFGKIPVHDEYSHGADAFRYLALSLKERKERKLDLQNKAPPVLNLGRSDSQMGWMGH